jgi:hypothetical protein
MALLGVQSTIRKRIRLSVSVCEELANACIQEFDQEFNRLDTNTKLLWINFIDQRATIYDPDDQMSDQEFAQRVRNTFSALSFFWEKLSLQMPTENKPG